MSVSRTRCPRAIAASAIAAPMPVAAPVTRTTRSVSGFLRMTFSWLQPEDFDATAVELGGVDRVVGRDGGGEQRAAVVAGDQAAQRVLAGPHAVEDTAAPRHPDTFAAQRV